MKQIILETLKPVGERILIKVGKEVLLKSRVTKQSYQDYINPIPSSPLPMYSAEVISVGDSVHGIKAGDTVYIHGPYGSALTVDGEDYMLIYPYDVLVVKS